MKPILFIICTLAFFQLSAQQYNVLLIPDSLKKNANAVIRTDETQIIIKDIGKAIIQHKYAITILNEAGKKYSVYFNSYSDLTDLHDIDGNLYDAFGKHLKNVKKKDIGDYSADDAMTLASDARFKMHSFDYTQYPYTVEYEDEKEYNGILFLPTWYTQPYENVSIESCMLKVQTPVNYKLRYRQTNYQGNPGITITGDKANYVWQVNNQTAKQLEPFGPSMAKISTNVILAPTQFSIDGYTGTMDTWKNFGAFFQTLGKGKEILDDVTKRKVHELTDTIKNNVQKVIVLYKYMQNNTRYVNVSFGIGGWQPHDAVYVAQKKYGDCKALSNFMGALLKEAGIDSYYAIIKSGANYAGIFTDFPCNQFDHVIRCVPLQKDTLWLECTSQTLPAGYLSDFTFNRATLLITDNGGLLAHTPNYTENENQRIRKIVATINDQGGLIANVSTNYKGIEYDNKHELFHQLDNTDIRKYLNAAFPISSYEINDFSYSETNDIIPSIKETIKLTSGSFAHISGKRLFIVPDIISKTENKLDTSVKRIYDIVNPYSFKQMDTLMINVPEGYVAESLPQNETLESKFGKYNVTYTLHNNQILFTRTYQRIAGTFPPEDFSSFATFINKMYKSDRAQVVLIKKDVDMQ